MKILNIVGARPNFMKVAPLYRAFRQYPNIETKIVHTGQHYDIKMSDVFFQQLGMPAPDYFLGVGGGSHTEQTAKTMLALEPILQAEMPDLLIVVGDVNATIASTLVAIKLHIPVAHVEAGLRSGDRSMPEEVNRLLTDAVSDYLFVTEQSGMNNLAKEGVPEEKVFFVGNCMIDSLIQFRETAKSLNIAASYGLQTKEYVIVTMHRPSNVDDEKGLKSILEILKFTTKHQPVVFPVHPRTKNNFEKFGLMDELKKLENIHITEPLGYLEFLSLMDDASLIVTDSGGIQEETTYLQIPCLTFRTSTERPVSVELGTNILMADLNVETAKKAIHEVIKGNSKKGTIPPLWDGHAAERIAAILNEKLNSNLKA